MKWLHTREEIFSDKAAGDSQTSLSESFRLIITVS